MKRCISALLLVFLCSVLLVSIDVRTVKADLANEYTLTVDTTAASSNGTNYAVGPIIIKAGSGTDSTDVYNGHNFTIHVGSTCQDDFDDVCFYDSLDNPLPQIRFRLHNGSFAEYWFKLNFTAGTNETVTIKYGDASWSYNQSGNCQADNVFFYIRGYWQGSGRTDSSTTTNSYLAVYSGGKSGRFKNKSGEDRVAVRMCFTTYKANGIKTWKWYSGDGSGDDIHRRHTTGEFDVNTTNVNTKDHIYYAGGYYCGPSQNIDPYPSGWDSSQAHYKSGDYADKMLVCEANHWFGNVYSVDKYIYLFKNRASYDVYYTSGDHAICSTRDYNPTVGEAELSFRGWWRQHMTTDVNITGGGGGPPPKYYFNFNHSDLDAGDVDSKVSWQLHNASGQISYTEGEATLNSGTYTLKTYRYGYLINETSLDTASYGNSTVNLTMQMKSHSHTVGGYITSNTTITSITIHQQTAINLTFTITAATPCLLIVDVGGEPDNATKDGSPFSNYTYTTSPSKHLKMELSSLSTFMFSWDSPPEQEGGQESSGASGGEPWKNRLWVTVLYEGEVLHLANVSVEGGKEAIWGLTNIFGEIKFFLPKGSFTVLASHEDYGSVAREVLLEDDVEVEIDIAKGSPLTVFPSLDFGEVKLGVLVLPVLIFVVYAFSLALRNPKRKYRYSYLK